MTFTWVKATGGGVTLANSNYVIMEVPDIPGAGVKEVAMLAGGITTICTTVGQSATLKTVSGNGKEKAISDGANTRFDSYANGYGNVLTPATYPPDQNIYEPLTGTQYLNNSPFRAPSNPAQADRRVLLMPIIQPNNYSSTVPVSGFGAFLLRSSVPNDASLSVEYLGDAFVVAGGSYDPGITCTPSPCTNLTKPVLYK
jgi:hypothetical protein